MVIVYIYIYIVMLVYQRVDGTIMSQFKAAVSPKKENQIHCISFHSNTYHSAHPKHGSTIDGAVHPNQLNQMAKGNDGFLPALIFNS